MTDLKPCPFCGGEAEMDTRRQYRALTSGRLGNACAVYCTACEADVSVCLEDVPEWTEEALQYVTERWNTRPREAQLEAEIAELRAKLAAYTDELDVAEFHLHSLVDDEHAGGVMHGDIEGTFQRLRNFLTKQEEG